MELVEVFFASLPSNLKLYVLCFHKTKKTIDSEIEIVPKDSFERNEQLRMILLF